MPIVQVSRMKGKPIEFLCIVSDIVCSHRARRIERVMKKTGDLNS